MESKLSQVKEFYNNEKKEGGMLQHIDDIPSSYEALTPEWLTHHICKGQDDAKVINFTLDEVDNGSANRRRIHLTYNQPASNLPETVFCKASFDLINRINLGISRSAENEVNFYSCLRDRLKVEAPHAFYAGFDEESWKSLVILEDLARTVTFCDETTEMNFAKASNQVSLLANLHGKSHIDPDFDALTKPFMNWPDLWKKQVDLGMELACDNGFVAAEELIPASVFKHRDIIWRLTNQAIINSAQIPAMITHNDVHLKNWYILDGDNMGLSDWHTISARGNGFRDFAYAMSTALTTENRRLWERDLLTLYIEKMKDIANITYSFDEAWLHYRQQLVHALSYWTLTLCPSPNQPDMQPEHTTRVFINRISQAMEDLETISSF